ncbi:hypothetical protein C2E23DRAFT_860280 [Lenzites betulinus]|nr:hypothetical protein C2E23DRAFT_860280 [Lenzites betulinus]
MHTSGHGGGGGKKRPERAGGAPARRVHGREAGHAAPWAARQTRFPNTTYNVTILRDTQHPGVSPPTDVFDQSTGADQTSLSPPSSPRPHTTLRDALDGAHDDNELRDDEQQNGGGGGERAGGGAGTAGIRTQEDVRIGMTAVLIWGDFNFAPGNSETDAGTAQSDLATPTDEYGAGRIVCETCGEAIPIRDEATGGFTVKLWETHRSTCQSGVQHAPEIAQDAPAAAHDASSAQGPAKRRRAKRTEDERIAYLSSDPYVAKFEPYRVLCKSCAKWIRLRPNSTYCSIPWDAHRKSCLAKRVAKNARPIPVEEDGAEFGADPRIKRSEGERVLCRVCDKWVTTAADDEAGAGELWRQHTAVCQPAAAAAAGPAPPTSKFNIAINVPPPPKHLLALASSSSLPPSASARPPAISPSQSQPLSSVPSPSASAFAPFKDYAPGGSLQQQQQQQQQEPRRRNAEQRAAALRADPLLGEVEPGRVFCKCCQKWVQLRQDSTYCSYPWLQHRAKCLQRRSKVPERDAALALSDTSASPEPEEGMDVDGDGADAERARRLRAKARLGQLEGRSSSEDEDAQWDDAEGAPAPAAPDLDSPAGRLAFVARSIRHLYRAAYARADELTIAALVTYLNAALPPDKHEDFDTAEVTKAASALHERRLFVFEGDVIRIAP